MINTYNESELHKALKDLYCPDNGEMEYPLLGSICDIFYDEDKIIEIQTSNLSALRVKLEKFLPKYKVKVVYPIMLNAYNLVLNEDASLKHRRKSPKHGCIFQIFRELSGLYHLLDDKHLSFDIVYIDAEIIKQHGVNLRKNKRHKNRPSVINKRLLNIIKTESYSSMRAICESVLDLLADDLFTTKDLKALGAGKYVSYTTWFLKKVNFISPSGKKGNCIVYKKNLKS